MKEGFSLICQWLVIDSCSKAGDGLIFTRTCFVGDYLCISLGWQHPGTLRERAATTWLVCAVAQIQSLPLPPRLGLVCQGLWQTAGIFHSSAIPTVLSPNQLVWLHFCFTHLSAFVLMMPTIGLLMEVGHCVQEKGTVWLYRLISAGYMCFIESRKGWSW